MFLKARKHLRIVVIQCLKKNRFIFIYLFIWPVYFELGIMFNLPNTYKKTLSIISNHAFQSNVKPELR